MALPLANAGGPYANIAYGSLPTTQVLAGSGTPGTGGTSITAYAWSLVDKPTGSAAALSSASAQNPTINGIDLPGTYRCKLIVTDDVGGISEPSTLDAPDDAFADVCATTENAVLEIPAASERNWKDKLSGWADEIDDQAALLVPATTTQLGIVLLSELPVDSANPVAVTQDRFDGSATIMGKIAVSPSAGNPAQSLARIPVASACNAIQVAYVFGDGGTTTRTDYVIDVYVQSSSELEGNTFNAGDLVATLTVPAPAASGRPITGASAAFNRACVARDVVTFKVSSADADVADQGSDLQLSVTFKKKW